MDGKTVLVSSTNWSGDGVLRNRDAGLIIHNEEVAQYYLQVFLDDWDPRAWACRCDSPMLSEEASQSHSAPHSAKA